MLVLYMIYVDWIVEKKKNLQVHGDVFLMLWTFWGFGRDISCTCTLVSMKPPEMNL